MNENSGVEELIEGNFGQEIKSTRDRKKIGRELPRRVANYRRCRELDEVTRAAWAHQIGKHWWSECQDRRGERWKRGWDELIGALALSIELLDQEIPDEIQAQVKGTPAEEHLENTRQYYQRYALVVDGAHGELRRIFATPCARDKTYRVEGEQGIRWGYDGTHFKGRSHTLMLGLIADGCLDDSVRPVAATGELEPGDSAIVRPVQGLVTKAMAWWDAYPNGHLITAPLGNLATDEWTKLTEVTEGQWTVGGSIAEIEAKLGRRDKEIDAWDGTPMTRTEIYESSLSRPDNDLLERPTGDRLLDAAWNAYSGAESNSERRGIIIEGKPGSGKSILSQALECDFASGPLSALGCGVRRNARELAEQLEETGDMSWANVLAAGEPEQRNLFETLEDTGRLVPVVDGLDELGDVGMAKVSRWLREGTGWWIATSRPHLRTKMNNVPAWVLRIEEFDSGEGREFLTHMGREGLIDSLFPTSGQVAPALRELTRTPLHLSLIAQVFDRGERLEALTPDALYTEVFDALLATARVSKRLDEDGARLLESLKSKLIGEIALAWLQSSQNLLGRATIEKKFDELNRSSDDEVQILDLLEFGHLLVRVGADRWEFGHRTIAEWAAAHALRRRVDRRIQHLAEHEVTGSDRDIAATAEAEVLEPFLKDEGLPREDGQWTALLRFYSCLAREPLALLDRLVGPDQIRSAENATKVLQYGRTVDSCGNVDGRRHPLTATDVAQSWSLAFQLLRNSHWKNPRDARTAWEIAARYGLHSPLDRFCSVHGRYRDFPRELSDFAHAIQEYLPVDMDELIKLAAKTEAQRKWLRDEPTRLLPAIPPRLKDVVLELLATDDSNQQRSILKWCRDHEVAPSENSLVSVMESVRRELKALQPAEETPTHRQRGVDGEEPWDVLKSVEELAWEVVIDAGYEPKYTVVSQYFDDWPSYLEDSLRTWFGAISILTYAGTKRDEALETRRNLLAALLDDTGKLATNEHDSGEGKDTRQLNSMRRRVERLIDTLSGSSLDDVVGELWAILPDQCRARRELVRAVKCERQIPGPIPAVAVLEAPVVSQGRAKELGWTKAHRDQLKELAIKGRGRVRYYAVLEVAVFQEDSACELVLETLESSSGDDQEFQNLAIEYLNKSGLERLPKTRPELSSYDEFSLEIRAHWDIQGWKHELLDQLNGEDDELRMLVNLSVRHDLNEALPTLLAKVGETFSDDLLVEAAAYLATEDDEDVMRDVVQYALRSKWPVKRWNIVGNEKDIDPGKALGKFLKIEDLGHLAHGKVSALESDSLAAAIRNLGPDAQHRLREIYREMESDAQGSNGEEEQVAVNVKALRALAETTLASLNPDVITPSKMAELLFELSGGDTYRAYSTPGKLGGRFEAPGDQNWYSEQLNSKFVECSLVLLESSLRNDPEDWEVLRELFQHPSGSLRKIAFDLCADCSPKNEIAELAIEALEGHIHIDQTRHTGKTTQLSIALHQRGAGEFFLERPNTATSLVAAVRQRLTPAHSQVIAHLASHELSSFRMLAARWAGELQTSGWESAVVPLLEDAQPAVVDAALGAVIAHRPEELGERLVELDDSKWTSTHDVAVFKRMLPADELRAIQQPDCVDFFGGAEHLSQGMVQSLLDDAAGRMTESSSETTGFCGFPSLVEQLLDYQDTLFSGELETMIRAWTDHSDRRVRVVARRLLAERDLFEPQWFAPLFSSDSPVERVSGAECAIRLGSREHREQSERVLRAALSYSYSEEDYRVLGLEPSELSGCISHPSRQEILGVRAELRERVLWALREDSPEFAPLIELVADDLYYDGNGFPETHEDELAWNQMLELLKSWESVGGLVALDLMDRNIINDGAFDVFIRDAYKQFPSVRVAIEEGARQEMPASSSILERLRSGELRHDFGGMAQKLREDVFPEPWPRVRD